MIEDGRLALFMIGGKAVTLVRILLLAVATSHSSLPKPSIITERCQLRPTVLGTNGQSGPRGPSDDAGTDWERIEVSVALRCARSSWYCVVSFVNFPSPLLTLGLRAFQSAAGSQGVHQTTDAGAGQKQTERENTFPVRVHAHHSIFSHTGTQPNPLLLLLLLLLLRCECFCCFCALASTEN